MDIIIILCMIVGVALIGASFIIKEGSGVDSREKEKIAEEIRAKALSDESLKKVMTKVEKDFTDKLSGIAEDKLVSSTDHMSEITNNKMLAINEMSGQLIEKIEQNHKEVIFLYDMLNEKSDNLKDFSAKIDGLRKELESEEKRIKALNHDLDDKIVKLKEVRQTVITKPAKAVSVQQDRSGTVPTGIEQVKATSEILNNVVPTQAKALVQMQKKEQEAMAQNTDKQTLSKEEKSTEASSAHVKNQVVEAEVKADMKAELSTNDKILLMKEEGKSVLEISKALGIGQGEVQLILGLFGK